MDALSHSSETIQVIKDTIFDQGNKKINQQYWPNLFIVEIWNQYCALVTREQEKPKAMLYYNRDVIEIFAMVNRYSHAF